MELDKMIDKTILKFWCQYSIIKYFNTWETM